MPKIFKDENVIIKSITGSGKTLSYLVPIYTNLLKMEPKVTREKGTLALVICPTRELCIQCIEVCQKCGKRAPNIVEGGLMGGENPKKEKARLRKGVGILVGTPGRILYHLQNS